MGGGLTHIGDAGEARMVDVSGKETTARRAVARARVAIGAEALARLRAGDTPKGNVVETCRLAGIMAAKRTAELIPLCHPIALADVAVEVTVGDDAMVEIIASASAADRTGVEMEAMTAAAVAALTLYDMLKGVTKAIEIRDVVLIEKDGGRSGRWRRGEEARDGDRREDTAP